MTSFPAYLASKTDAGQTIALTELTEADLMEGDVTVKVEYSALNYKDGLAMTNSAPIIRQYPLIPGIDFAGTVISSRSQRFNEGDRVVLNGFGVGESHSGGFAGLARVKSEWLVPLPESLSTRQAMAIGTARACNPAMLTCVPDPVVKLCVGLILFEGGLHLRCDLFGMVDVAPVVKILVHGRVTLVQRKRQALVHGVVGGNAVG